MKDLISIAFTNEETEDTMVRVNELFDGTIVIAQMVGENGQLTDRIIRLTPESLKELIDRIKESKLLEQI